MNLASPAPSRARADAISAKVIKQASEIPSRSVRFGMYAFKRRIKEYST
jgi:hypothetical protein